jgi:hypothetical protein
VNRVAGPTAPLRLMDRIGTGISPLWVIGAIFLCANSAWWGIPLVLAGAQQRRYAIVSPSLRQALANQVRFAMQVTPMAPDAMAATPVVGSRFCSTRGCAARLPAVARFCPRCGASASQASL